MKKHFYHIVVLAMSVVMTVTAIPPVYANEAMYRLNNDVVWTNPDAACAADSGSSTVLSGDNNMVKIWNYLISKGLNDNQAAGVMGNIAIESGHSYSPFIQEFSQGWGNGGYGLVQWTGSRRTAVVNNLESKLPSGFYEFYSPKYGGMTKESDGYIPAELLKESNGKEINDAFLAIELDFLYAESTTRNVRSGYGSGTEWDSVKAAKTLRGASDVWLFSFERPRDQSEAAAANRAKSGQEIYDKLKGQSSGNVSPASFSGGSGECSSLNQSPGSVNALQELTLKYADPEKHLNRDNFLTKTPDYDAAIKKARSSGQYTGDQCYGGGIDCGAFVTRLLIDSGWEPNYNYGGKISAGASNTTGGQIPWLEKNWEKLGTGSSIDTASLQPGDVAINNQHTFVYVGDIPGFKSKVASASQCGKAPSAGWEQVNDPSMTWYRKKAGSGEITGV